MARSKKVTGVTSAIVNLKSGGQVTVRHGQDLPPNVDADEVKRLDGLGVFGDTPRHLLPPDARAAARAGAVTGPTPAVVDADAEALRARVIELEEQIAAAPPAAPAGPAGWITATQLAEMNVDDVTAYIDEHPEQREYVIALEREGDARKSIIGD